MRNRAAQHPISVVSVQRTFAKRTPRRTLTSSPTQYPVVSETNNRPRTSDASDTRNPKYRYEPVRGHTRRHHDGDAIIASAIAPSSALDPCWQQDGPLHHQERSLGIPSHPQGSDGQFDAVWDTALHANRHSVGTHRTHARGCHRQSTHPGSGGICIQPQPVSRLASTKGRRRPVKLTIGSSTQTLTARTARDIAALTKHEHLDTIAHDVATSADHAALIAALHKQPRPYIVAILSPK